MARTIATALVLGILAIPGRTGAADAPRSRTFDARGVEIHYLDAGEGEPVVLIHGLYSSAEINWGLTGVLGELARTHRVIALDLPGHGRSARPGGDAAYGLQIVEDVVLLLDHLKIEKAHVVGYSLGGMVALKLMARHPDRVLSGTIGGMGWLRDGSPLQAIWDRMAPREGKRTPPAFLRGVGKLALTAEELKGIKVPVEVIVGERDPVKRMYVEPLRRARKDWPVVEIDGAGHIDCLLKRQFRDEVARWVRGHGKS
jgi:pimeloyl-ACP methyl ester carboxylesterase